MITGVGADIIEVDRIVQTIERCSGFLERIFTEAEREYCQGFTNSGERFAGRFAAKEAVAKALGTSLCWLDVEIVADPSGKPNVVLRNAAAEVAAGRRLFVSISHCRSHAVAYAVAEEEMQNA